MSSKTRGFRKWLNAQSKRSLYRYYRRPRSIKDSALGFDKPVSYVQDQTRTLKVSNEFFQATATWQRKGGIWTCTQADPIIRWMVGMDKLNAKLELLKLGCSHTFSPAHPVRSPQDASSRPRDYQQHSDQDPSPTMLAPVATDREGLHPRHTMAQVYPLSTQKVGTNQTYGFTP